ncbi:MAG: DUF2185 domain-containing protein [Steroidobacteraceae bacterium]
MSNLEDCQTTSSPQVPSWHVMDGAALAKANPYTFYKPSDRAIALLRPGNCVKLIFAFKCDEPGMPAAERMWVRIFHIEAEKFYGTLDNDPVFIKDLVVGASVTFESCHIIEVDVDDPVPDPTLPYQGRCLVTKVILEGTRRIGALARGEPAVDNRDSGWRIWAGDEPDEYLMALENFAYVSLGAVLRRDDSIVALLQTPVPCAFKRDPATGLFTPVSASDAELRWCARIRPRQIYPRTR